VKDPIGLRDFGGDSRKLTEIDASSQFRFLLQLVFIQFLFKAG
jgi:hypothetical protein